MSESEHSSENRESAEIDLYKGAELINQLNTAPTLNNKLDILNQIWESADARALLNSDYKWRDRIAEIALGLPLAAKDESKTAEFEKQLADKDAEIEQLKSELAEAKSVAPLVTEAQPQEPTQTWGKVVSRIPDDAPILSSSGDEENTAVQNAFDPNGPLPEPEREPATSGIQKFDEALKKYEEAYSEEADGGLNKVDIPQKPLPDPNGDQLDIPDTLEQTKPLSEYVPAIREYLEIGLQFGGDKLSQADQLILGIFMQRLDQQGKALVFGSHRQEMLDLANKVLAENSEENAPADILAIDYLIDKAIKEESEHAIGKSGVKNNVDNGEDTPKTTLEIIENSLEEVKRGGKKPIVVNIVLTGIDPTVERYTARLESIEESPDSIQFEKVDITNRQPRAVTLRLNGTLVPKGFGLNAKKAKIVIDDGGPEVSSGEIDLAK